LYETGVLSSMALRRVIPGSDCGAKAGPGPYSNGL
jgi:hypothetical protein